MSPRRWLAAAAIGVAVMCVASCQASGEGSGPASSAHPPAGPVVTSSAEATAGSEHAPIAAPTEADGAPWSISDPADLTQWPDMCTTWSDAELKSAVPVAVTVGRSGQKGHSWSVQDPVGNVACTFTLTGNDPTQTWTVTIRTAGFDEPAAVEAAYAEGKAEVPGDDIVDYGTSLKVADAYWDSGSMVALLENKKVATVLTMTATVPRTGPNAPSGDPAEADRQLCATLMVFVADQLPS